MTLNLVALDDLPGASAGLLYGQTGTLNMAAHLVRELGGGADAPASSRSRRSCSIAFGIKAAAVPAVLLAARVLPHPPAAVSAIFAGLLTKVGVYALIRVFTLVFSST